MERIMKNQFGPRDPRVDVMDSSIIRAVVINKDHVELFANGQKITAITNHDYKGKRTVPWADYEYLREENIPVPEEESRIRILMDFWGVRNLSMN